MMVDEGSSLSVHQTEEPGRISPPTLSVLSDVLAPPPPPPLEDDHQGDGSEDHGVDDDGDKARGIQISNDPTLAKLVDSSLGSPDISTKGVGGSSPRSPLLELEATTKLQPLPLPPPSPQNQSQDQLPAEPSKADLTEPEERKPDLPDTQTSSHQTPEPSTDAQTPAAETSKPPSRRRGSGTRASFHGDGNGKKLKGSPAFVGRKRRSLGAGRKRKRKIRFAPHIKCKEIKHVNQYSDEEFQMIWMIPEEYQIIRAMVKATVLTMMKGEVIPKDDEDFCTRGLEYKTKAGSKARTEYKMKTRFAVLNAQEETSDADFIREASEEESHVCKQLARDRAVGDEEDIQAYLEDVRLEWGLLDRCRDLKI